MSGDQLTMVFFIVAIPVGLCVWFFTRKGDRKSITEDIETHGGKVVEIVRTWGGDGRYYERAYDVTYITSKGVTIEASCRTDGAVVYWLSDKPPEQ